MKPAKKKATAKAKFKDLKSKKNPKGGYQYDMPADKHSSLKI